ncbi:MAG: glycosyltransferase [Pseudomonadota bacterium]|nr:glycosyltransferase [Pseudomonadota bacterium]
MPSFLKQPDSEVVVVDYSCPDGTTAYVQSNYPAVRVVRVPDQQGFSVTHARNVGAQAARGKLLAFLDADVIIADHFIAYARKHVTAGKYGVLEGADQLRGCCVVTAADYEKVGGYDEAMHGYVAEDIEFCDRLKLAKCEKVALDPRVIVESIAHSDQERVRFYDSGIRLAYVQGKIYRTMKAMLLKQTGRLELELEMRRQLFAQIREVVRDPKAFEDQGFRVEVELPVLKAAGFVPNCEFTRTLVVGAKLRK